jgi:DNA-binding Lrp family transcriptional regulator
MNRLPLTNSKRSLDRSTEIRETAASIKQPYQIEIDRRYRRKNGPRSYAMTIGRGVQAYVSVKIRPQALPNASLFCDDVADLPGVVGIHVVTGAADLIEHGAVATTDTLRDFVPYTARREEITDIRTSIIDLSRRASFLSDFDE